MPRNDLSLSQAALLMQRLTGAPKPAPSTMNRWCERGVTAPNGSRVKLASRRRGRYRYTSELAVRNFLQAMNPPSHEDADAELAAEGL